MHVLYFVLLLISIICFVAASLGVVARVNLVALGLAFWVAVPLLQQLTGL